MPRTLHGHPPSSESSKVGWHHLGTYWSPVPCREKWGVHAGALQSHTWTWALGDGEDGMKLPNPWLVKREEVRGHKKLVGG